MPCRGSTPHMTAEADKESHTRAGSVYMTRWRKWKIEMHDVRKIRSTWAEYCVRYTRKYMCTLQNITHILPNIALLSWIWLPGSYYPKYLVHPVSNGYSVGKLYKANGVVCKSPSHEFIRLNQTNTTHQCSHELDQSWDKHFSQITSWLEEH